MSELTTATLEDRLAREEALDTSCSILVQAPAGSGKTELLVLRFLKLLAKVVEPEQVLAITFTKAATAEMRHRILLELDRAKKSGADAVASAETPALRLATAALENSNRRGWRLLDHSQRLNIQTIDSLCLRIARQMPLRSRAAATLEPIENSQPVYRSAARKTFDRLGGGDIELNQALTALLALRDTKLKNCESLIAGMLATRDQWGRVFPLDGDVDWDSTRARFELPFKRETERVLGRAHALLSAYPELMKELLVLANYACGNTGSRIEIELLAGLAILPAPTPGLLEHWRCLCNLLLTNDHAMRKKYTVLEGFPTPGKTQKDSMLKLADFLRGLPGLEQVMAAIRRLPPARYTEDQWQGLRHMFTVLRQANQELEKVFVERSAVDFVELGNAARAILDGRTVDGTNDPAQRVLHLLVDEFQDTSRSQYQLISALLRDWRSANGRTFFLVGDPMQSIYMFRQAEVELFDLVSKHGLVAGNERLPVKTLRLSTNFRSSAVVVKSLNRIFETIFPHGVREGDAAVDFLAGTPRDDDDDGGIYEIHPTFTIPQTDGQSDSSRGGNGATAHDAQRYETDEVLRIIREHLPRIESAEREKKDFTVAVLVRAKSHAARIAAALRDERIPFRAVELETLSERQEILDLQSLTRALLHPMDRIAWLALLRAPWCGLALSDLHLLCSTDERQYGGGAVSRQIRDRLHLLSEESRERVAHVSAVLQTALRSRYRESSFSSWIERTWHSLGGPACVDETGYENARAYFSMLEQIAPDGIAAAGESMQDQLSRLFARPDPSSSDRCGIQIMSIHKAKGLGFDVVLLPGLHRLARQDSQTLIQYLERETDDGTELLAAPIDKIGDKGSELNSWLKRQKAYRETEERKRLLYVACTRAREEVHLFGTATVASASLSCRSGTLLHTAWPALHEVFDKRYADRPTQGPDNIVAFERSALDEQADPGIVDAIAAATSHSTLHRLPSGWRPQPLFPNVTVTATSGSTSRSEHTDERTRLQASRSTRVLGTVVHVIFQRAARLLGGGGSVNALIATLSGFQTQAATLARNEGLPLPEAYSCARLAVQALQAALGDPNGLWILSSHTDAQTESSWTGIVDGNAKTLRIDRSFRAGQEPRSEGTDCLWIIDYKTATHRQVGLPAFLESERLQYAEQLGSYGRMMRLALGEELSLRLGLYYPLLKELIWWSA